MIAYITEQGSKITREGQRLIVTANDTKHILFIDKLEQLILCGNITCTSPAIMLLLRENIDTVFLRADGRFMGRLINTDSANVALRKRQFLLTNNNAFCLSVARQIIQAKIINQATLLSRVKRSRKQDEAGEGALLLRNCALATEKAGSLDILRGIEGNAASIYFKYLPLAFNQDWGFTKRVRRPPTDPVNAVLSLLYTLLINRCYAALRIVGLDTQPGILHTLSYGRNSLPLDLVEEFRAILADTLTIALFNTRQLDWSDFETPQEIQEDISLSQQTDPLQAVLSYPLGSLSSQELNTANEHEHLIESAQITLPPLQIQTVKKPLLLSKTALKMVLTAFCKKMETTFTYHLTHKVVTFNEALILQSQQLRKVIEGELDQYSPLILR